MQQSLQRVQQARDEVAVMMMLFLTTDDVSPEVAPAPDDCDSSTLASPMAQ